jgi:hypothetical protein
MRPFGYATAASAAFFSFTMLIMFPVTVAAQRAMVEPGPSVAGHWTGKMVFITTSKREVSAPIDFELSQSGDDVSGELTYTRMADNTVHTVHVKGVEEEGKLNLTWDFSDREHCRFHLTLVGDTLNGELFNYHDNPGSWRADATGPVTLSRAP